MKRRAFIRKTASASLLSLLPRTGLFAETAASSARPNILFIFSDQHHADLTSYAGNPNVHTPALDALAASGMRFNRAYCQDGICCASRNSLFTGQYPRTFGSMRVQFPQASILDSLTPIQSVFHRAGYYTFTAGKRHLMTKVDVDWDYTASGEPWLVHDTLNYWTWIKNKGLLDRWQYDFSAENGPKFGKDGTLCPRYEKGKLALLASRFSVLPPGTTWEAFAASQTVQFLQSDNAKKKPFFAYCGFYRPHQPYTPLKKYAEPIDPAALVMPVSLTQKPEDLPPDLCRYRHNTGEGWAFGNAREADYRNFLRCYIGLLHEIDDHIHNILGVLEKQGLAENTIVIYSADHGDFAANHGLVEKLITGHNFFEDTLRVPFIIRWLGKIPTGVVRSDLVELVDLYPTLLDLCGLATPQGPAPVGRTLTNTLLRQAPVGRTFTVSENWSQATIITDTHKYGHWLNCAVYPGNDYRAWGNMLVERSTDPLELKNLIRDPACAATAKVLESQLMSWLSNIDDSGRREYFAWKKCPYTPV